MSANEIAKAVVIVFIAVFLPPIFGQSAKASVLTGLSDLFVTLNGVVDPELFPGFGGLSPEGSVSEFNRLTQEESGNSFSAFGMTKNSRNEFWTSTGNKLLQFDPRSGTVLKSFDRVDQGFLNLVFTPDDRLLGWSNGNGILYEIQLSYDTFVETPLVFVGLHAGGLTEMAFHPDGTLFGVDNRNKRIVTIDLVSGALTTITQLPFGDFLGLAFAPDGSFFFTDNITRTLFQVDGMGDEMMRLNFSTPTPIMGLEFAAVPEPGSLYLFFLGLVALGMLIWRRRHLACSSFTGSPSRNVLFCPISTAVPLAPDVPKGTVGRQGMTHTRRTGHLR